MSLEQLIAILLLVAGVGAGFFGFRRRLAVPVEPSASEPGPWNPTESHRSWLESHPDAADLYRRLGYDLTLEWQVHHELDQLAGLVAVEIPDFEQLVQTLGKLEAGLADDEHRAAALAADEGAELWRDALALRHSESALLKRLNRDPIGEILPFIEKIPVGRGAKATWRMPVEVKSLHKRPSDHDAFSKALTRLGSAIRSTKLRRRSKELDAALEALERVRRDLERKTAYLPTSMRDLSTKVELWLGRSGQRGARERRVALDELLIAALRLRHTYALEHHPEGGMDEEACSELQEQARVHADAYLREKWMHVPGATRLLLGNLLTSELAPLPKADRRRKSSSGAVLALVCDEVLSGHYDPGETERRLHVIEAQGRYVHSLVFALLRLSAAD